MSASGYITLKKARLKAAKEARIKAEDEKQQRLRDEAIAVKEKIKRKLARKEAKAQRKRELEASKRIQLRAVLLPAIRSTSPNSFSLYPASSSTNPTSPSKLLKTTDGGWYTGNTDSKGRRDGFGCRYYRDGALLYRGYYKQARFHGFGERYAQDGRIMYKGNYQNDEPEGEGRGWSLNGESYEGLWKNGKPCGKGKLYDRISGKCFYFGEVSNWLPDGPGTLLSPVDGSTLYEGAMVKGERHGFGTGIWPFPKQQQQNNPNVSKNEESHPSDGKHNDNNSSDGSDGSVGSVDSGSDNDSDSNIDCIAGNASEGVPIKERLRFRGMWVNNIPQGKGVYLDSLNRERHVGTWLNGEFHGQGVHTYADGAIFKGSWIHGRKTGTGEYKAKDGSYLKCTWKDGYRSGKGSFMGPVDNGAKKIIDPVKSRRKGSRSQHVGEWSKGAMEGKGDWWGPDGSHYHGSFKNNKKHGKGTLQNADGTVLSGQWENGHIHGYGELFEKPTAIVPIYAGNFFKGKFHGKGIYTYKDFTVYEGEWENGKRHGRGEFRLKNGTVGYEGEWKNDLQDGFGLTKILGGVYKNCIYKGYYKQGLKDGPNGELSTEDGKLLYKGEWKNDYFDGKGEWWPKKGREHYNGNFTCGQRHGMGKMEMEDGRIYEGEWDMGEMHGMGKLTDINTDEVQEGEFVGNRFLESKEQKEARFGYEEIIGELIYEVIEVTRNEEVIWERKEKKRLERLAWLMEDPEYEAKQKIEQMRKEKLRQREEKRLQKLREEKMNGAIRARQRRARLIKERQTKHKNRVQYSEMLKMLS
jgi:hypothetical protein